MRQLNIPIFANNTLAVSGGVPVGGEYERGSTSGTTGEICHVVAAQSYKSVLAWVATINPDFSKGDMLTMTVGGATTIAPPLNMTPGFAYTMVLTNSGAFTVTWQGVYFFTTKTNPAATQGVGAIDIYTLVSDGTNVYVAQTPNMGSSFAAFPIDKVNFNPSAQGIAGWTDTAYDPSTQPSSPNLSGTIILRNPNTSDYTGNKYGVINSSLTLGMTTNTVSSPSIPASVGQSGWVRTVTNTITAGYNHAMFYYGGLTTGALYTVTLYSSLLTDGSVAATCKFQLNDLAGTLQTLSYNGNTTTALTWTGVAPDVNMRIYIQGLGLLATPVTPICVNASTLQRTS